MTEFGTVLQVGGEKHVSWGELGSPSKGGPSVPPNFWDPYTYARRPNGLTS